MCRTNEIQMFFQGKKCRCQNSHNVKTFTPHTKNATRNSSLWKWKLFMKYTSYNMRHWKGETLQADLRQNHYVTPLSCQGVVPKCNNRTDLVRQVLWNEHCAWCMSWTAFVKVKVTAMLRITTNMCKCSAHESLNTFSLQHIYKVQSFLVSHAIYTEIQP